MPPATVHAPRNRLGLASNQLASLKGGWLVDERGWWVAERVTEPLP